VKDIFLARVMHLHYAKKFKERVIPMTPRWTGYLVRALNEFASLTAACGNRDASDRIPIRAKASTNREHQSKQKKSSGKPRRRKYDRK
jgi:hypothetical protein